MRGLMNSLKIWKMLRLSKNGL